MKKASFTLGLVTALMVVLMGTLPGFCASNIELEERINKLEEKTRGDSRDFALGRISDWVTLSGTFEVEAGFDSSDLDDTSNSDISLATAELGIEASPRDWVTGFMLLSWDEAENELIVDEAHITLGATDEIPFSLSAGKIYVPFGALETMMISDPITLDIAETVDNAVQVGLGMNNGIRAAVYALNGEAEEVGDNDDTIDVFGVSLGYALETDAFSIDLGVDWINNILESGGLRDVYDDKGWSDTLDDQVPGFAVHAMANFGPVCLMGEYVTMTDDVNAAGGGKVMDEMSAYALEIGYTFDVAGFETTAALGYQASDDAADVLPETKILGSVGVGITDNLSVAIEYAAAENNSAADGGDDDEIDTFTMQLAFEF